MVTRQKWTSSLSDKLKARDRKQDLGADSKQLEQDKNGSQQTRTAQP